MRQIVARSRNGEGSDDDEEGSALARSASADSNSGPHHTLSSRLRHLVRSNASNTSLTPTTLAAHSPSTRSSSSSLPLSRTPSHTSTLSRQVSTEESSSLGQPADRPTTPLPIAPLSEFGLLFPGDTGLTVLGPPAYRPNSARVGSTSRLTESIIPVRTTVAPIPSSSTRPTAPSLSSQEEEDEEEEEDPNATHWPNEKVPRQQSRRHASTSTAPLPSIEILPPHTDTDTEPTPDHSEFAAHLATDDKDVLRRIREAASEYPVRTGEEGTAPMMEIDEDGFESFPAHDTDAGETSGSGVGGLPAPSQRVITSFDTPSSLANYGRRVPIVLEASAPPADDYEYEHDEAEGEEGPERLEGRRGEGII